MRDEGMLAEIEDFLEGFNQPTHRGIRVGRQVSVWSSQHGWSGFKPKSLLRAGWGTLNHIPHDGIKCP
jgi:hypothetical protein